tara:strand:- start:669 stop:836 length:168 start_codon:yes stop_codon:yes gene_type:complete
MFTIFQLKVAKPSNRLPKNEPSYKPNLYEDALFYGFTTNGEGLLQMILSTADPPL